MKAIRTGLVLLMSLAWTSAHAGLENEVALRTFADTVVEHVAEGRIQRAFDHASTQWTLPRDEIVEFAYQTRSQFDMVADRFGKKVGYEFIRTDSAGESFKQLQYIVKFEHHAIRWIFIFYRAQDTWTLNAMTWDDSIDLLF